MEEHEYLCTYQYSILNPSREYMGNNGVFDLKNCPTISREFDFKFFKCFLYRLCTSYNYFPKLHWGFDHSPCLMPLVGNLIGKKSNPRKGVVGDIINRCITADSNQMRAVDGKQNLFGVA